MAIQVGLCSTCRQANAYTAVNCLDCGQRLPWADAAEQAQQAKLQAQQAAQQAALQAQQRTVVQPPIPHSPAPPQTPYLPPTTPGQAPPVSAYQLYAASFIGRFSSVLEGMDNNNAVFFGVFCAFLYNACIVIGAYLIFHSFASALSTFFPGLAPAPSPSLFPPGMTPPGGAPFSPPPVPPSLTVVQLFKLVVIASTPLVSISLSCTAIRRLFGSQERSLEGDVFVAGVCLLPTGLWVLATGILGFGNYGLSVLLGVFAACYTIMLLYRGLMTISRLGDVSAAVCVPLVLMGSAFLTKIVFMRLVLG